MNNHSNLAAFFDSLDWNHVVPLVNDLVDAESGELDLDLGNWIICTDLIGVFH